MHQNMPTKNPFHEVITGRLFTIPRDKLDEESMRDATIFIDMSDCEMTLDLGDIFYISWPAGDNVEQKLFDAVVLFCSTAMKGPEQKILITGAKDAVDVVASCILREYLGVNGETAISIIRENKASALNKPDLIETVMCYKPT